MANQRNNQNEEEYLNEYYENEFDRLELELDDADMGLVENSALLKAIENSLTVSSAPFPEASLTQAPHKP